MEYILKCGKKVFTGNSASEVEWDFISWADGQDNFVADNYTILGLHDSPFGEVRAEVEKSTAELLNKGNYVYVVVANRDWIEDDDTYEASYHLSKTGAIVAAREILKHNNKVTSTRVIAHLVGGIDNDNTWDSDSDILCAHFNRTNSLDPWED